MPMSIDRNDAKAKNPFIFDDDDDDDGGWQDMPIVKEDEFAGGLDEEDQKKYRYAPTSARKGPGGAGNATGDLLDFDDEGREWRAKAEVGEGEESSYTRLRVKEDDDDADDVHLRTKYLFDEDKAMTPLSQMQATKDMLTEAQRIAYVGLCALTSKEMVACVQKVNLPQSKRKDVVHNTELWMMKIMGRLYYHMELETAEQKMIESLAMHGVIAEDLVPSLMTTHTVANPEYDPEEARRRAQEPTPEPAPPYQPEPPATPTTPRTATGPTTPAPYQTTARVLDPTSVEPLPGVSTTLSSVDKDVTLDVRWTILCDLFLILIADSVYDARSRVLLEAVALKLGLGWLDVVKFEARVTEALEIQEGVEKMENKEIIDGSMKSLRKRRYMMMGLATLGGGIVIGLSAGLLAPVIGAGLGAALTTFGISGTTAFLASTGGAAVITTGGVLTGSGIAARGMARRTQQVRTFEVLPLHNNKRVSCILTVPGFMSGKLDDPRLPFSVLDPIVGDVFSVLWEPEMIRETGSALKIMTSEILTQLGQTLLQQTVMTALMGALQWPIILTKLGYLIDNPWSNALDRARGAGAVLAQLLLHRHLGVRPITLIGFSLGARVIFYALLELAKAKAWGIVQDVFLLGSTIAPSPAEWNDARAVVAGRFVNAYAANDWVLNYLYRAAGAALKRVAGLRPVEGIAGLENVDVTDKVAGHMSYRTFMPLILDQLGFPVSADFFDEPVEPDFEEARVVIRDEDLASQKKSWFSRGNKKKQPVSRGSVANMRPPAGVSGSTSFSRKSSMQSEKTGAAGDDELPPRESSSSAGTPGPSRPSTPGTPGSANAKEKEKPSDAQDKNGKDPKDAIPLHAGFDFAAMHALVGEAAPEELQVRPDTISIPPPPPYTPSGFASSHTGDSKTETEEEDEGDAGLSAAFGRGVSLQHEADYAPSFSPFGPSSATTHSLSSPHPHISSPSSPVSSTSTHAYTSAGVPPASHSGTRSPSSVPPGASLSSPAFDSTPSSPFAGRSSSFASHDPEPPALSFGAADGSVWSPPPFDPGVGTGFGGFGSAAGTSIPSSSADPLGFGGSRGFGPNLSTTSVGGGFGAGLGRPPDSEEPSLSFGGADGSITPGAGDPWRSKPEKKGSAAPSWMNNPWSN